MFEIVLTLIIVFGFMRAMYFESKHKNSFAIQILMAFACTLICAVIWA